MLLIELVCLLKSNLPKTRLLSCNLRHYLLPFFFSGVLFSWLCFDDFLRLLLPLIFSPTYHLPKLCAPQGLGAERRKEQSLLLVEAGLCSQSPPSYPQPSSVLVFEGAPRGSGGQASSCCFSLPWTLFLPSPSEKSTSLSPSPDFSHSVITVPTQAQRAQTQIFWLQVELSYFLIH